MIVVVVLMDELPRVRVPEHRSEQRPEHHAAERGHERVGRSDRARDSLRHPAEELAHSSHDQQVDNVSDVLHAAHDCLDPRQ